MTYIVYIIYFILKCKTIFFLLGKGFSFDEWTKVSSKSKTKIFFPEFVNIISLFILEKEGSFLTLTL
jgi:hypothetical protein